MSILKIEKRNGEKEDLDINKIHKAVEWACDGLDVSISDVESGIGLQFFDGMKTSQIQEALISSSANLISVDNPDYEYATSRLLLLVLHKEVTGGDLKYPSLSSYIKKGINNKTLDSRLLDFDFTELEKAIKEERDFLFKYLGLRTLYDRYLITDKPSVGSTKGKVIEMPQHLWMRVAMGLCLGEEKETRTKWAIKFYNILSEFKFVSSTPTLFNSGTTHPQMSSCFLNTTADHIWEKSEEHPNGNGIFGTITECALLSKYSGGIGTDWTRVRPTGSLIKSTQGISSGIIPYLKIFNDTAVAVNQGGKRNGSFAAYLEPWHGDVERFITVKKPNGEERLRAREIFPAMWINDLFMERIESRGKWSLFDPSVYPELHELYGDEFKKRYEEAEKENGAIKTLDAYELWKKIITALVESGAPWITFKDEMNRRNPQSHRGVIHCSNLCTEIALNNSDTETAVCNLGSLNITKVDPNEFHKVIPIAMRMLDNVINLNFYPSEKARVSNTKHRPVGLGIMGWSDYLVSKNIRWESIEHLRETDRVFEAFSYWAIKGSVLLAKERGTYSSYQGSKWSRGILPIDTARNLDEDLSYKQNLLCDWSNLRGLIKKNGLRNSNCTSIAPTATISNIVGTEACIEPMFKKSFIKENKSGKFKIIAPSLRHKENILKDPELNKIAFDIDQKWIISAAAVRQKYLCQAQSINIFKRSSVKGKEISDWYFLAWKLGLKSTYYLKQQINEMSAINPSEDIPSCSIDGEECESCQ